MYVIRPLPTLRVMAAGWKYWAVVLPQIGVFGFTAMMIFLAVLVVGFVYEWKKGALDWE